MGCVEVFNSSWEEQSLGRMGGEQPGPAQQRPARVGAPARLQELNSSRRRSRAHKASPFPLEAIFPAALSRKPTPLTASPPLASSRLSRGTALLRRHLQTPPSSRSAAIRPGARELRDPGLLPASVTVTSPRRRSSWGQGAAPHGWGGLGTSVCSVFQLRQVNSEPLTCSRIHMGSKSRSCYVSARFHRGGNIPGADGKRENASSRLLRLLDEGKTSPNPRMHTQSDELRENVGRGIPWEWVPHL